MMSSTTSSSGAIQAQNGLSQFMMHLLSWHIKRFGLGDPSGPVLPVCSRVGHKSCPWEVEVSAPQSSTLSPSCSTFQKWAQRGFRDQRGWTVVWFWRCLPQYLRTFPPPQLPTQTHPWLWQWEDHSPRQMAQSGLVPVLLSSPSSEQFQSHWLLLITSLTCSALTGSHKITGHSWKTWNQPARVWNKRL